MSKARDLANLMSSGGPLEDGQINVAEISDLTATASELNILDGVTATVTEINKLAGLTASTSELNKLTGVLATTGEINKLYGLTATTSDLNNVAGINSSVQSQLDLKAPLASPSFTGTATFSGTEATVLPVGTAAERPGTPTNGMIRYNSEDNAFEGYQNGEWAGLGGGGGYIPIRLFDNTEVLIAAETGSTLTVYGRTANTSLPLQALGA